MLSRSIAISCICDERIVRMSTSCGTRLMYLKKYSGASWGSGSVLNSIGIVVAVDHFPAARKTAVVRSSLNPIGPRSDYSVVIVNALSGSFGREFASQCTSEDVRYPGHDVVAGVRWRDAGPLQRVPRGREA